MLLGMMSGCPQATPFLKPFLLQQAHALIVALGMLVLPYAGHELSPNEAVG